VEIICDFSLDISDLLFVVSSGDSPSVSLAKGAIHEMTRTDTKFQEMKNAKFAKSQMSNDPLWLRSLFTIGSVISEQRPRKELRGKRQRHQLRRPG
jgi:hypothetical protein